MTLPAAVRSAVERALEAETGAPTTIAAVAPVGGGCISPTARIDTAHGRFFLKWAGPGLPAGLLEAEARGLDALAAAGAVRVPGVVARGGAPTAWLLTEWLEPGAGGDDPWTRLGRELAALHRHRADRFGAGADNFIGSLAQRNDPADDWAGFWRDRRLAPQLERAAAAGHLDRDDRRRFERLFDRLETLLAPGREEGPSLLHGDLWSGNVHMTAHGPAILDPSVYHGHREVDLAMADLFGGFGPGFRAAYEEAWPLAPGYEPARRSVYQLYYLLVHVNLFGAGYVPRTRDALRRAGDAA